MVPFDGLSQAWRWSVRKILRRLVRPTVKPDDAATAIAARPRPVCYVLETESQTDLAVLGNVCRQLRFPSPERRLALGGRRAEKAYFDLTGRMGFFKRRLLMRAPRYLEQLLATAAAHEDFDVDLVPVAIFWGRAPQKELSLWRLLFADDWAIVGRSKKMLQVMFNGHNTLVYFGEPWPAARGHAGGIGHAAHGATYIAFPACGPARAAPLPPSVRIFHTGVRWSRIISAHAGGCVARCALKCRAGLSAAVR